MANEIHTSGLTSQQITSLFAEATTVAHNAYAPYSSFRVGSALLLSTGEVVTGCNVENNSFRLTCCAEQTAIARAVAQHGPSIRIRAVAIANLNHAPSPPCGACRQTILEFATADTWIFYATVDGSSAATISTILPEAFLLTR